MGPRYTCVQSTGFTHLVVSIMSSLDAKGASLLYRTLLNRPCFWLPGGVDMFRLFNAVHDSLARLIDVYSIGRRYEGIHSVSKFWRAADRGQLFYVHDTIAGASNIEVYNHQHHRKLLANIAKRSRYFVVAPAKMDTRNETGGQIETGYRYFEGAAAGS